MWIKCLAKNNYITKPIKNTSSQKQVESRVEIAHGKADSILFKPVYHRIGWGHKTLHSYEYLGNILFES